MKAPAENDPMFALPGLNGAAEFVPVTPEPTDRQIDAATEVSAVLGNIVEPFGTKLAIQIPDVIRAGKDTSAGTGPKGGGNFDDYKTKDE